MNNKITESEYFSPIEADERLTAAEMRDLSEGKILRSTAVPHCDCQDATLKGAMSPVKINSEGNCLRCNHAVLMKVPRGQLKHGSIRGYQHHKCRCDLCKTAMIPEWTKRRERFNAAYKGRKKKNESS